MEEKNLRICEKGHKYYKSSDCPTCPVCEAKKKPKDEFLSKLGGPARRALEREGITSPEILAEFREKEILRLHGMGPSSVPKLKKLLADEGLSFKE